MEKEPKNPIIFISGMPRSGSTWLASIVNQAPEIKHYFHEPFNPRFVPGSRPFYRRYLKADSENIFAKRFYNHLLSGKPFKSSNTVRFSRNNDKKIDPDDLIVIKDVHSSIMLSWIEANYNAKIITIIRNPFNLVGSWYRVWVKNMPKPMQDKLLEKPIQNIMEQTDLVEDFLEPYKELISSNSDFWEQLAVFWGMVYKIEVEQYKQNPQRIILRHEDLCDNPKEEFQKLFQKLNLSWTEVVESKLEESVSKDSKNPYNPKRNTVKEKDKWKSELEDWQIKKIIKFTEPFQIEMYKDMYVKSD